MDIKDLRSVGKKREMKVALGIDHLIERDEALEIVELFCEVYPEATFYTYAHQQGKILGHIELHPIRSTFIGHLAKTLKQWRRWGILVPTLQREHFRVEENVDVFVSFSRGLMQGIPLGPRTKHLCYLYENEWMKNAGGQTSWASRFFRSYLQKFWRQSFQHVDKILVSSKTLAEQVKSEVALKQTAGSASIIEVLPPFFNSRDYPLVNESFEQGVLVAETSRASQKELVDLIKICQHRKTPLHLVGTCSHLPFLNQYSHPDWPIARHLENPFDPAFPAVKYWGNLCSGELSLILQKAKAVIDLWPAPFPFLAVKALATGRPLLLKNSPLTQEFFTKKNALYIKAQSSGEFCREDFVKRLDQLDNELTWFTPLEQRNAALKFPEMKFRQILKYQVESLFQE